MSQKRDFKSEQIKPSEVGKKKLNLIDEFSIL